MAERKIIIFTALEIERRAIERVARASRPCFSAEDTGGTPVPRNAKGARDIEVISIGIRAVRGSVWQSALRSAAQSSETIVIVAGLGGGLDPSLRVGDVVIDAPDEMRIHDLPFRFGSIHTSADMICTPQDKSRLFQSTSALAVDMETALVRKVAAQYRVPVIAVRAISDAAHAAIDPELLALVDDLGRPRAGRIALALVKRPARALALRRLGRDTRLALRRLEIAIRQVVEQLSREPSGLSRRRDEFGGGIPPF